MILLLFAYRFTLVNIFGVAKLSAISYENQKLFEYDNTSTKTKAFAARAPPAKKKQRIMITLEIGIH